MSSTELHRRLKRVKTLCMACQGRKARFKYRGEVRADRDHTLCFECYRGEVNRARSRRLTERIAPPFGVPNFLAARVLDQRQVAHQDARLSYMQRQPTVAS